MKNSLLFALLGVGLFATSCSTAEKLDQTVDDVYYSPGRDASVVKVNETKDAAQREQYENYLSSTDEQFLRMKVSNYSRWFMLDDYSYWNDSRYDFVHFNYYSNLGYSNFYGNYYGKHTGYYGGGGYGIYNPIYTWGNPYYTLVNYYNPKASIGKPSESGISAYKNKNYNNSNYIPTGSPKSAYNNSNYITPSSSNFSGLVKKVFSSSSANGSYDRAARTFDNSSSANRSSSTNSTSNYSAPSSNAGGNSGGVKSSGSSASTGRTTRN